MMAKRLILAGISLGAGVVMTFIVVTLIGTTAAEFGPVYFSFTALSLSLAVGIWLDKFMGTGILPG